MDHASQQDIYRFISSLDPFDKLSENLLSDISKYITLSSLAKGESLPPVQLSQGYLYIIRTGAVEQLEINGDVRARLDEGDVFGYTMVLDGSIQTFQARALENTQLYMLSSIRYKELIEDPLFAAYFATHFRARLKSAVKYSLAPDDTVLLQSVKQFCNREITRVDVDCPIQEVARQMAAQQNTSAVIVENETMAGFVSDRNLTRRVIATGIDIKLPISKVMSTDTPTIDVDDMLLHAVSKMMRHSVRNLPVMSENHVIGVINVSDLVQKHSAQAVYLLEAIRRQDSVKKLKRLMPQRQFVFDAMVGSGVRPQLVGQVMTMIADTLTSRIIELAQIHLIETGAGEPPCAYAWMVAGSHARYEMQMVSDQDNAIVLSNNVTDEERKYFVKLAEFVTMGLADCGYHLCPGQIMATNPKWCQPVKTWREYYLDWITHPELEALLNVSVFMDIRCIHGDTTFVKDLQRYMISLVKDNKRFISLLVSNMLRKRPPLGFFRSFVLIKNGKNKNKLNIKSRAVNPVVDLARVYGLLAGCEAANTYLRLQMAYEKNILSKASHDELIEAYNFINSVRLRYQLKDLEQGQPIDNHLPPKSLSQFERNHLKEAFWIVTAAQEIVKQRFMTQARLR